MAFQPQQRFMQQAIRKAEQGIKAGQTPFGACIVQGERVVACSHNVVWRTTDITAHAEITAIRLACQKLRTIDLSGTMIYSTCEPCPMCFAAIHWARIPVIVFGASIRDAARAGFNELRISNQALKKQGGTAVRIIRGFERQACLGLFANWLGRRQRQAY